MTSSSSRTVSTFGTTSGSGDAAPSDPPGQGPAESGVRLDAGQTTLRPQGLIALVSVAFIATYVFGSANVALPWIGAELGASHAALALVMGGYAITFAALLIWFGRVGDNLGRKRVLQWGLLAVIVTSLAVGAADSIWMLVGLRFAQGAAVAAAVPQLLSSIQATTTGSARARAIAGFGAASGLGGGVGVVLGGALTQLDLFGLTWRPVMWSTALFAVLALGLSRYVPATFGSSRRSVDLVGAGLLTVSLVSLISALSLGPSLAWPWWLLVLLALSVVGLLAFWRYERGIESSGAALVPPSVVSLPPVAVGLAMALLFFAGYGAFMYEWSAFTRQALHTTALVSGLGLGGFCVTFVLGSLLLERVTALFGTATMVVGGVLQLVALAGIFAVGLLVPDSRWVMAMLAPTLLLGFAQAIQFGPLVQSVMAGVPDQVAGLTGGLVSTAQQTALALGVATIGAAFFAATDAVSPRAGWGVGIGLQIACTIGFTVLAAWMRRRVVRP